MSAQLSPDHRTLRNAFGAFATGVTIVTTRQPDGRDVGLTANSFSSVSLSPPMILWSLASGSSNVGTFRAARHFAVHILAADQEPLSVRFATRDSDRFAGIEVERGPEGIPLLKDCSARFICRTNYQYEGGDHVIFVGEVLDFTHSDRPPLVFHGGRYGRILGKGWATPEPRGDEVIGPSPDDLIHQIARVYYGIRHDATIERQRLGWSECDYVVLSVLGWTGDCRLVDINAFTRSRAMTVTPDMISTLADKGVVEVSRPVTPESRLSLTEAGRRSLIAVMALLKAGEAEAVAELDPSEVQLLKQLLGKLAATSTY